MKRSVFSFYAGAAFVLVPHQAIAQVQEGVNDGEIIVTAQFREQSLQQTPIAITAITGEMLEARGQTNLAAIAGNAPSVTLKAQGASFGPALGANIRGIGQFDPSPAMEPSVGIYVDDVYYASLTGSVLDLLDLDRVEVLRGPQGTLSGRNSIGGSIKLYSRKPTGEGGGYVQAAYGSRNRIDLRASADFALSDSLFGRVSGVSKTQEGYVTRYDFACINPPGSALNPEVGGLLPRVTQSATGCELGKLGSVDTKAVRGQLRFDNGGPLTVSLAADYTKDDRTQSGDVLVYATNNNAWIRGEATAIPYDNRFVCGKFCNYATFYMAGGPWEGPAGRGMILAEADFEPSSRFEGWGVSGQVSWDISDRLKLDSITAYRAFHSMYKSDTDLSPLPVNGVAGDFTFWSLSQELRLNGSLGDSDWLEYTIGGYFIDQRTINRSRQEIRYTPWPGQFQLNDVVNVDSKAVFAQLLIHPTEDLTLIGGLRYTDEHKDYTFSRRTTSGLPHPFLPFDGVPGVYDGTRLDWRLGLQYQVTDSVMAYGQVSTGFKGGGINPRPFTKWQVVPFAPETLTSYEIGIKSELFDRVLRVNLAAFYSDYKNIQLTLVSCPQFSDPDDPSDDNGSCSATANAGDGRIKGFEAEVLLRPAAGLSIEGSFSHNDFKYTSINPLAGGPTNPRGPQLENTTPYSPRWKWGLGIQYEIDLGESGSLTPRFDAAYQSSVYSNSGNTIYEYIPSYTLANARASWSNADRDLEIALQVSNLFDKYYAITAYDSGNAGFATMQPGQPREWALSVKKSF